MTINIPKQFMGKPVEGAMERVLKENPSPVAEPGQVSNVNIPVNVSSNKDFWTLENVLYRNQTHTINLSKSLLDNGNAKTQQNWADYSEKARKSGNFYVGDMPLYHAVFTTLFNQKNKPEVEKARAFIQKQMREKYLMTLTRIAYQPKGKDKIIHNFGTSQKYELDENILGEDRFIQSGDSPALKALLGYGDINTIKSVYNWINGTDTYIWRLNSRPKSIDERVAWFDALSDWADLDCDGDPDDSDSSLGVRLAAKK